MDFKDISIIILLYKTPDKLIKKLRKYKNFKILILDQSNNLTNKIYLKKFLPNIQYYGLTNKNMGFAKAQNFLIKQVKTRYFFSTQPDIDISINSILNLKKTIIKFKKDCILAVPNINDQKNITKIDKNDNNKEFKIKDMIGASFMSDKKKFIKIGMFDKNFFFYWEDIDLSYRISKTNYSIYINLKSKANHAASSSSKNTLKTLIIRYVNFKFGEYFFTYKIKKLRTLKIIRQIFTYPIYSLLHFFLLQFNISLKYFCYFIGIFKFLLIKSKILKN